MVYSNAATEGKQPRDFCSSASVRDDCAHFSVPHGTDGHHYIDSQYGTTHESDCQHTLNDVCQFLFHSYQWLNGADPKATILRGGALASGT